MLTASNSGFSVPDWSSGGVELRCGGEELSGGEVELCRRREEFKRMGDVLTRRGSCFGRGVTSNLLQTLSGKRLSKGGGVMLGGGDNGSSTAHQPCVD